MYQPISTVCNNDKKFKQKQKGVWVGITIERIIDPFILLIAASERNVPKIYITTLVTIYPIPSNTNYQNGTGSTTVHSGNL